MMTYTKNDVGPYKNVNGEDVLMDDAERQAMADQWNAAKPAPLLVSPVDTIISDPVQLAALKAALAK